MPITTRWVDTNKSNDEPCPNYRSRFVARETETNGQPELYSDTPPIELARALLAKVAPAQVDPSQWCGHHFKARPKAEVAVLYSDISRA